MVKLKICGLTRREDYQAVCRFGAHYAGFIFFSASPRGVSPRQVRSITASRPAGSPLRHVGVFVNESISRVKRIFHHCRLDGVQLHGEEDEAYCRQLGLPCWKVLRVGPGREPAAWGEKGCGGVLIDTYRPRLRGGTGESVDLEQVRRMIARYSRVMVAGGVSMQNIDDITGCRPWGVDVNSSIEVVPGRKDHRKLEEICKRIKEINRAG